MTNDVVMNPFDALNATPESIATEELEQLRKEAIDRIQSATTADSLKSAIKVLRQHMVAPAHLRNPHRSTKRKNDEPTGSSPQSKRQPSDQPAVKQPQPRQVNTQRVSPLAVILKPKSATALPSYAEVSAMLDAFAPFKRLTTLKAGGYLVQPETHEAAAKLVRDESVHAKFYVKNPGLYGGKPVDSTAVIVKPIDRMIPQADLEAAIKTVYTSVSKVERFGTADKPIPIVKLTVDDQAERELLLKEGLKIFHQIFRCQPPRSKPEPLRCFKCNAFGHLARNCKNDPKCGVCGGGEKDCPSATSPKTMCQNNTRCSNCGGDHPAFATKCPTRKERIAELAQSTQSKPTVVRKSSRFNGQSFASVARPQKRHSTNDRQAILNVLLSALAEYCKVYRTDVSTALDSVLELADDVQCIEDDSSSQSQ